MKVSAFAVYREREVLKDYSFEIGALGSHEVLVKVTHCGLCHSDLHMIDDDWGVSEYPLVPGHEIVGFVEKVGKEVNGFKVGDRVGVGWQCGSCLKCKECLSGFEQLCTQMVETIVGRHGGFADHIVVDSRFVYKIPDEIDSAWGAPLLCAGLTVYQPLFFYGAGKGVRVAVVGLGGLGHLAVQFAKALGCEVAVISTSLDKGRDAIKFGASKFSTNVSDKKLLRKFDIVLDTTQVNLDWGLYIELLAPLGRLVIAGIPVGEVAVPIGPLVNGQKSVCGASLGGRTTMKEMLVFAAKNNIKPQVELMPIDKINEAVRKLREGRARYRIVLDLQA
ncbi:MAG: Alcohol dehydrogenase GroES domain protein [Microgenomates group bacterium GW2011_GWA2_44_7]|nr:MAG: Alcohol dehydrogenase GroES domain protein [Microgenomates group bacterium GW2011_GWA2_44_7]KKT78580.1 MAG: Alcohol dehydrogenase GroES domain protein [Microgenomates group bacterium GW2011_GWB1_44_8]